jgi:hypothetical protein
MVWVCLGSDELCIISRFCWWIGSYTALRLFIGLTGLCPLLCVVLALQVVDLGAVLGSIVHSHKQ